MAELLFGAAYSSLSGQAVGLNMANQRGACPMTPCACAIFIPTSIRRLGVIGGS